MTDAAGRQDPALDAMELPWASLPLAEALPRIPEAADFVRSYGLAVHLHDLVSRLTASSPAEARRLLLQGLVSVDGQVVQAWTVDLKPGSLLTVRNQGYRVGPLEAS